MYSLDRRRHSQEPKPERRLQVQPTPMDSWDDPVELAKALKKLGLGAVKMAGRFAKRIMDILPEDPPRSSSIE